MPALTMRGRYLMREYWTDSDLFTKLTAEEREFYQGLWMLSDDDGWLPRDIVGIGGAILQYMDRKPREALVVERLAKLQRIGKVRSFRCCLYLPTVARYPRAGNKSHVHRDEHQTHSKGFEHSIKDVQPGSNGVQTGSDPSPVPSSPVPSLPSAGAPAPDGGAARPRITQEDFDRLHPRPRAVS
jgi:hypothetical protein